jgi:hypothetical protein
MAPAISGAMSELGGPPLGSIPFQLNADLNQTTASSQTERVGAEEVPIGIDERLELGDPLLRYLWRGIGAAQRFRHRADVGAAQCLGGIAPGVGEFERGLDPSRLHQRERIAFSEIDRLGVGALRRPEFDQRKPMLGRLEAAAVVFEPAGQTEIGAPPRARGFSEEGFDRLGFDRLSALAGVDRGDARACEIDLGGVELGGAVGGLGAHCDQGARLVRAEARDRLAHGGEPLVVVRATGDDGVINLERAVRHADIEEGVGDAPIRIHIGAMQNGGVGVGDGERLGGLLVVGLLHQRFDRGLARDLDRKIARGLPTRLVLLFEGDAGLQLFEPIRGKQIPEGLLVGPGPGARINVGRRRPVGVQRLQPFDFGVGAGEIMQRSIIAQSALVDGGLVDGRGEQDAEQRRLVDMRIGGVQRSDGGRGWRHESGVALGDERPDTRLGIWALGACGSGDEGGRQRTTENQTHPQHCGYRTRNAVNESI